MWCAARVHIIWRLSLSKYLWTPGKQQPEEISSTRNVWRRDSWQVGANEKGTSSEYLPWHPTTRIGWSNLATQWPSSTKEIVAPGRVIGFDKLAYLNSQVLKKNELWRLSSLDAPTIQSSETASTPIWARTNYSPRASINQCQKKRERFQFLVFLLHQITVSPKPWQCSIH